MIGSNPSADPPGLRLWRLVACGSTLAMVASSWPLWSDGAPGVLDAPPRVPFVAGLPAISVRWWLILALGLAAGPADRVQRGGLVAAVVLAGWAILRDQNRLQPWMGQFLVEAVVLSIATNPRALGLGRWLVVILYAWSGWSKLDSAFVRELGSTFLDAGLRPLGLRPEGWPPLARSVVILLMPVGEMLLAVGLALPRTRRLALGGAVGLHLSLLALFGPGALNQSLNVRIWNAAMIARDLALFAPAAIVPALPWREARWGDRVGIVLVSLLGVLPMGEAWGRWDLWPSHALYASHGERAEILIHAIDSDQFPELADEWLGPPDLDDWRRVDLTGWSRATLGTPLYPQNRVRVAIARSLAKRPTLEPVRVREWDRADRWTGSRPPPSLWVGTRALEMRAAAAPFGAQDETR